MDLISTKFTFHDIENGYARSLTSFFENKLNVQTHRASQVIFPANEATTKDLSVFDHNSVIVYSRDNIVIDTIFYTGSTISNVIQFQVNPVLILPKRLASIRPSKVEIYDREIILVLITR